MNLTLSGHDDRYAVEQLLLSLFPEGAEVEARSCLHRGETWLTATARVTWDGRTASASRRLKAAEETGCIVTAEEANILGGLGGAVAEIVSEHCPVPVIRVGVKDIFGRSGDPYALLERYGLTAKDVAAAAKRAVSMKK